MINKEEHMISLVRSRLRDYSDAQIFVKGTITIPNTAAADANANNVGKKFIFKNCALFTNFIGEINNTQVDNVKNINVVMPMYNLVENVDNYSKTSGNLWQYCKDIPGGNNNGDIVTEANVTDS